MKKKTTVLIVDDSSVMRNLLKKIFSTSDDFEVIGVAQDPYVAREKIAERAPDIMTLDIEMPKMDGLTFLKKVMEHFPIRTLILSSLSTHNSETALSALENGAIDVMAKPTIDLSQGIEGMAEEILTRCRAVAAARAPAAKRTVPSVATTLPRIKLGSQALAHSTHQVVAVASSTGGTEALRAYFRGMPADLPGHVIVQHMPPVFTKTFANHLSKEFPFEVKEAEEGDKVMPGRVLLAPGNFHMELRRAGGYYYVTLHQEPLIHGVRPGADFLLKSTAKYAGVNAVGVVLTGMGRDGAAGLLEMKQAGAHTITQDEDSCVVYGMPKAAFDLGASTIQLPLDTISAEVLRSLKLTKKAA